MTASVIGPVARILIRYLSMALMAKGYFSQETADALIVDRDLQQLVEMGLGLAMATATEVYYKRALKRGWRT
jgi:uncharacterized integral membrane protein